MTSAVPPRSPKAAGPFTEFCGSIAVALPFLMVATSATGSASWRADEAAVRTVGFVLAGGEGLLSAILGQLTMLVPLGNRLMRAEWTGALATALAAGALYRITLRVLDEHRSAPRLAPPLALGATLLAALGPAWRTDGASLGGAAMAAALVLLGVAVALGGRLDARRWSALGLLVALAAAERHAAGLALFAAVATTAVAGGRLPRRIDLAYFLGFAVLGLGVVLAPLALGTLGREAVAGLGPDPLSSSLSNGAEGLPRLDALAAGRAQLGPVSGALAALGIGVGLFGRRTRPLSAALLLLVALGALFPPASGDLVVTDPLAPLPLLSLAALSVFVVLSVHAVALGLLDARVRFAETAATMIVVFTGTLVLVTVDGGVSTDHSERPSAAAVWTAESLAELPTGSLLLVQTPAVAYRLWSARLVSGLRPDLVVVPMPWLGRGALSAHLLRLEPGLAPLIRELAVVGAPSEYALSTLADARPLYVEIDDAWNTRLVEHLMPRAFWLGFAPHATGRSDRKDALEEGRRSFRRVLDEASRGPRPDAATLAVLGSRAKQQAFVLAALGDREQIDPVLGDLRRIDPSGPFARELERRLVADPRGRIDVHGLLR